MSGAPCPCGHAWDEHTPLGCPTPCTCTETPPDDLRERLLAAKRVADVADAALGTAMVARRSAIAALFSASTAYADATWQEGEAQNVADAAWKDMDAAADAMVAAGLPDPRQQGGAP